MHVAGGMYALIFHPFEPHFLLFSFPDGLPVWYPSFEHHFSVHVGNWGGMFTRILTFIAALLGAALPLTCLDVDKDLFL